MALTRGQTIFGVLSGELGNGITDLVANESFALVCEGLEDFLTDRSGLVLGE